MSEPILKTVLGPQWQGMPVVLQQRYANRPFCNDIVTIHGFLTVEMSRLAKLMAPIFHLTGTLVPYSGENIPVTVEFRSEPGSNVCHFDRTFRFPGLPPYRFKSTLHPMEGADLLETMPVGLGWQARYSVEGGMVRLSHRAHRFNLFGRAIRLPLEWLFGRISAEEEAVDDRSFRMAMRIAHPLLGTIYGYYGTFAITSVTMAD